MRIALILLVITLSAATAYAQDAEVVKPTKPQKQTTTTTTPANPKPKPSANTNSQTNTSSQTDNSSTTTTPAPKPTTGTINGHEWVDLGLSVKWATCNVGASSPSDYGNYYAWGETTTQTKYFEEDSKTFGKSMGSIAGNSQYDAARANWGSTWRLPTKSEIDELLYKCTWTWTTRGGNNGYKVTGSNGNTIFLPVAGFRAGNWLKDAGEKAYYWSATPSNNSADDAYFLYFDSGRHFSVDFCRNFGRSVRPVSE